MKSKLFFVVLAIIIIVATVGMTGNNVANAGDFDNCGAGAIAAADMELITGKVTDMNYKGYGLYTGDIVKNIPEGQGVFKYNNGDTYVGSFKNGVPEGYGAYTTSKGKVLAGTYIKGCYVEKDYTDIKLITVTDMAYNNGKYTGTTLNGKPEGQGKYITSNGSRYVGSFVSGAFNGYGEYIYPDGTTYKGSFVNMRFNGYGEYYKADGTSYLGNWENDQFNGYGIYKDCEKEIACNWINNVANGYCVVKYYDGSIFKGKYSNGKMLTGGKTTLPNGVTKRGLWIDGKKVSN